MTGVNEGTNETVTCFVHETSPYIWIKWDTYGLDYDQIKQTIKNDWVARGQNFCLNFFLLKIFFFCFYFCSFYTFLNLTPF